VDQGPIRLQSAVPSGRKPRRALADLREGASGSQCPDLVRSYPRTCCRDLRTRWAPARSRLSETRERIEYAELFELASERADALHCAARLLRGALRDQLLIGFQGGVSWRAAINLANLKQANDLP
jgi:hypothetical protein